MRKVTVPMNARRRGGPDKIPSRFPVHHAARLHVGQNLPGQDTTKDESGGEHERGEIIVLMVPFPLSVDTDAESSGTALPSERGRGGLDYPTI
jgi:hypothetical protein